MLIDFNTTFFSLTYIPRQYNQEYFCKKKKNIQSKRKRVPVGNNSFGL